MLNSKTLIKTIEEHRELVNKDKYRLGYHLMPTVGWLNDPNGLCQFNGIYHIYYQYSPDNPLGGNKCWGHYTTTDFITYNEENIALFPDTKYDQNGVYSGSALIKDNQLYYFYTGNVKHTGEHDYINTGREHNTMLVTSTNGLDFHNKICLLTNNDYPKDLTLHVRDPKVYETNDSYYLVLGARTKDDVGCVIIYQSNDLKEFNYVGRINSLEKFGYMWECPDLFELDNQLFLMTCPQGTTPQGHHYQNLYLNGYYKVNRDFINSEVNDFIELDYGPDVYASQTFKDEQGRRIMIPWMGLPDVHYTNPTVDNFWQHALGLPRELSVKDGYIYQQPLKEFQQLRHEPIYSIRNQPLNNNIYELFIDDIEEEFTLTLREDFIVRYHEGVLEINYGQSGYLRDTRYIDIDCLKNIRLYSDTSSVELFINDGRYTYTTRIYSDNTSLESKNCNIVLYYLDSFKIKRA